MEDASSTNNNMLRLLILLLIHTFVKYISNCNKGQLESWIKTNKKGATSAVKSKAIARIKSFGSAVKDSLHTDATGCKQRAIKIACNHSITMHEYTHTKLLETNCIQLQFQATPGARLCEQQNTLYFGLFFSETRILLNDFHSQGLFQKFPNYTESPRRCTTFLEPTPAYYEIYAVHCKKSHCWDFFDPHYISEKRPEFGGKFRDFRFPGYSRSFDISN